MCYVVIFGLYHRFLGLEGVGFWEPLNPCGRVLASLLGVGVEDLSD